MFYLSGKLFRQDIFRVVDVQVGEINKDFSHLLVQDDGVALLHELADDLAFVVLDNQNLGNWKAMA